MAITTLLLLPACTITYTTMSYKKIKVFNRFRYNGSKGVKLDSTSMTIQDDSISLYEMIQRHVQGVQDDTLVKEGHYDDDSIDHETDVSYRSQKTELDMLVYAKEHGKTLEQVGDIANDLIELNKPLDEQEMPSNEQKEATTEDGE